MILLRQAPNVVGSREGLNLLAPEFGISILAHPVGKMYLIQNQKKVAL
jgi:hypothetical protein